LLTGTNQISLVVNDDPKEGLIEIGGNLLFFIILSYEHWWPVIKFIRNPIFKRTENINLHRFAPEVHGKPGNRTVEAGVWNHGMISPAKFRNRQSVGISMDLI
jgi:hypothetical protein